MKIITGATGTNHITSADDGSLHSAIFGSGQFVLPIGNQFESEIISNNIIRIKSGDLMMMGRHGRVPRGSYDEVQIANGISGSNRNDIIVCEYSKVDNIETMEIKVVQGVQAVEPQDPPLQSGNILEGATINQMPLYRVKVNQVNLTEVQPLFEVKSLADNLGILSSVVMTQAEYDALPVKEAKLYFING